MEKISRYVISALAAGLLLGFVTDKPSWSCGAKLGASGAIYGHVKPGLHTTISTDGTLFTGTVGVSPITFIAMLRSNGTYTFSYSPNVTRIRLSIQHHLVYEGPPVEKFNKRGIVKIEPEWTGDEVWVEVKDQCSPSSLVRGFF